jgi:hypothetical protein
MATMVKKFKDKLTKPATPKTIDEMLAAGGRLVFNVPVTDEKGRALSPDEVKELHIKSARMQIASHEKTVSNATGLRPLAEIEADLAVLRPKVSEANKHWELTKRRFHGGSVEMPAVENAHRAFNASQRARWPVEEEYNKVKAADEARAEIERLQKEIQ